MQKLFQSRFGRVILPLVLMFSLGACSRLVTPDQTTEITEVRGGQYVLDSDHAALMFKLNHLAGAHITTNTGAAILVAGLLFWAFRLLRGASTS